MLTEDQLHLLYQTLGSYRDGPGIIIEESENSMINQLISLGLVSAKMPSPFNGSKFDRFNMTDAGYAVVKADIQKRAFKQWGSERQLMALAEECSEAIHIILRRLNHKDYNLLDLVSEIADVKILIDQCCANKEFGPRIRQMELIKLRRLEIILSQKEREHADQS